MQHDEFIGQVQHRARLPHRGDAERVTRIVLETLSERLTEGAARNLAAQLPAEIGHHMIGTPLSGRLTLEEFFQRLSLREGVPLPTVIHHARAVLSVVRDAVSPGALEHVKAQLPKDFEALFNASPEGPFTFERHRHHPSPSGAR